MNKSDVMTVYTEQYSTIVLSFKDGWMAEAFNDWWQFEGNLEAFAKWATNHVFEYEDE